MFSAQRQFLNKVDGIDGFFAQKTGGEVSSETNKVYDGGSLSPGVVASPPETDDVVLTRPYDPDKHQELLNRLVSMVGQWYTTVTITPTTSDLRPAKVKPRVYPNALLKNVREPESDASSGDAADFELTFAVGSAA